MQARKSTVLYQAHWHKGVVGIVASRLLEHYYRPTIVLAEANGKVAGSARSVSGFNIYEAIHECRDLLESYGGHFYAAGMTMQADRVTAFTERFEEVVSRSILPEQLTPEIEIDAELKLREITPAFYKILQQMEPFGPANMRPVFISRNVFDYHGQSRVVKELHLKCVVQQKGSAAPVQGIGFSLGRKISLLRARPVDLVYTLDENEWNGNTTLQMRLIDVRPA